MIKKRNATSSNSKPISIPKVVPQPLDRKNFSPFGEVITWKGNEVGLTINRGFGERIHSLAQVDIGDGGGEAIISIIKAKCMPQPLAITMMERHPLGSQAFIPLSPDPFLVVVAPQGKFDPQAIKVFMTNGYQGVNYRRGVWHHFCLPFTNDMDFLIVDREGDGHNCDEIELQAPYRLIIDI